MRAGAVCCSDAKELLRPGAGRSSLFLVIGAVCIVVGGLVAGVSGPLRLEHGSWTAAYLVLVGGVAQIALGGGQGVLASRAPSTAVVVTESVAWNLGGAAVIGGTLVRLPVIVDLGGIMLVIALALMIRTVRASSVRRRWLLWTYRAMVGVILVSIPIGLVLSSLRGR